MPDGKILVEIGEEGAGSARLDVPLTALDRVIPDDPYAVVGLEPLERGAATQVNVGGGAPGSTVTVAYHAAYTSLVEPSAESRPPYGEPEPAPARPKGKARGHGSE